MAKRITRVIGEKRILVWIHEHDGMPRPNVVERIVDTMQLKRAAAEFFLDSLAIARLVEIRTDRNRQQIPIYRVSLGNRGRAWLELLEAA